ncbi:hypothetical protein Hdeb2414_s0013g00409491 [Helianthus debilis subsp. tardiflorus]
MGFYSFALRGVKKIIINPPKSFHDWKMKFFFIREEVIPITMLFHESDVIENEDLPIPKGEDWYLRLMATPNKVFGEQVLVAVRMSDKWPAHSKEVHVLLFNGEVAELYQSAFPTFGGAIRPNFMYEQIRPNFMYAPAEVFATPSTATEGVRLPRPRPLRGVTSAGKEIVYLSSEESVGSLNHELSSWYDIFTGVLRDLRIDPEEKKTKKVATKKKAPPKKKVTVDAVATSKKSGDGRATAEILKKCTLRFRQSNLEDYIIASDSLEGLLVIGERPQSSATAASKMSSPSDW